MRVWTLIELFRLTRAELVRLHREILIDLADLSEESNEYHVALENLRLIQRVFARPRLTPW
jgi:hypothetical protein